MYIPYGSILIDWLDAYKVGCRPLHHWAIVRPFTSIRQAFMVRLWLAKLGRFGVARGHFPLLMGSRGARRLGLVVVQGAKALTVFNRRTVGRRYPKGRECPLVMGVSGELEGSPDLVMQRPNGALALTDPDHLGTGLGKCQRRGGCNGGAQRPPCQDGVVTKVSTFVLQHTSCGLR
jgi:hypothetical protein